MLGDAILYSVLFSVFFITYLIERYNNQYIYQKSKKITLFLKDYRLRVKIMVASIIMCK